MREILFRGKEPVSGEWIFGDYHHTDDRTIIYGDFMHDVDPDTVGQYTGKMDRKGIKIFEGDILVDPLREEDTRKFYVQWDEKCSRFLAVTIPLEKDPCENRYIWYVSDDLNRNGLVIGNITDTPELLEENK